VTPLSGGYRESVNTTDLITHWTMGDDEPDLDRSFAPSVDILAAVSDRSPDPEPDVGSSEPEVARSPLLVKRAGEDDWQPLVAGA
jgi:hypothetical protein